MAITFVDLCIFVVVFLLVLYYYGMTYYDYFKNTDIKVIKPSIPIFGSFSTMMARKEGLYEFFAGTYNQFPDEKYIGLFEGTSPMIMIRDVDLIKNVGTKSFDVFHDHRNFVPDMEYDILAHILFVMRGEKWREMRPALSPAFTSSKMRNLFVFMEDCAKDMIKYFMNQNEIKDKQIIEIDVKDTASRYTNDVIANTVFGIKVNSLEDRNNDIYKIAFNANDTTTLQYLKFFGLFLAPKLMKFFKIPITPVYISEFFQKLVKESIENREKTGFIRQDMINLLMQAKKGTLAHETSAESEDTGFATVEESNIGKRNIKKKWTDIELTAQAFLFFVAGFETTATVMMFFVQEMIKNPDVQKKLQESIDDCLKKTDGKVGYNDILAIKYLDMCVSETLRMWPPNGVIDRVCSAPFTLPPPNNKSTKTYEIQKNHLIWIPAYGIMHDPKYYPNPEKFDPERFSDENKSSIDPATYLPFGIGPRNCIGSRFALLEIKIFIFYLLSKFDIVPVEKTEIPIKLKKGIFIVKPETDLHVGLKLRH